MKALREKITKEMIKSYKLKELAKDDELDFYTAMDLYGQINETDEKIKFLKGLSNALKKEGNNDKNNKMVTK